MNANPLYSFTMEKPAKWTSTNPLTNFCMVSYAVSPERVRPYIPAGLTLDTRVDSRGEEKAFVSAVLFLNDHIRLFPTRWPQMTFHQVNYRTYVHRKEMPGVWFFRLIQHSKMANFNRRVFGAPTFYAPIAQSVTLDEGTGKFSSYQLNSVWRDHKLHLDVQSGADEPDLNGLFSSTDELECFLTSRPDGYFNDQRKLGVTSLTIWHELLHPQYGTARVAEFSTLSDLGLVPADQQKTPYCVMLASKTVLLGQLPKPFRMTTDD